MGCIINKLGIRQVVDTHSLEQKAMKTPTLDGKLYDVIYDSLIIDIYITVSCFTPVGCCNVCNGSHRTCNTWVLFINI